MLRFILILFFTSSISILKAQDTVRYFKHKPVNVKKGDLNIGVKNGWYVSAPNNVSDSIMDLYDKRRQDSINLVKQYHK